MASYPTSVKSFTTKNTGDTIQAAHVNDAQDEVTAIETGLLNGISHALTINSTAGLSIPSGRLNVGGASSLASLAISGGLDVVAGSTFGTINAGGSTFTAITTVDLTVTGSFSGFESPRVRLTHSADQATSTASAWVGLSWDTETYDSHGMHSTAANSSRVTFAHSTGVYAIGASLDINASNQVNASARILLNDSTTILVGASTPTGSGALLSGLNLATEYRIQSTADYVTVQCQTASASSAVVAGNSTRFATNLWARKVST